MTVRRVTFFVCLPLSFEEMMLAGKSLDTQHYDTQQNGTQHYDTQHYDTQHKDIHHNILIRHSA